MSKKETAAVTITLTINPDDIVCTVGSARVSMVRKDRAWCGTRKHAVDAEAVQAALDPQVTMDDDETEELLDKMTDLGMCVANLLAGESF